MESEPSDLNPQFYVKFQFNHEFSLTKSIEAQILYFSTLSVVVKTRDYFEFEEEERIQIRRKNSKKKRGKIENQFWGSRVCDLRNF